MISKRNYYLVLICALIQNCAHNICGKKYNRDFNLLYQWHYLQFDQGISRNKAVLSIFSFFSQNQLKIELNNACQYTGEKNLLFIGGDPYSENFLKGILVNLSFIYFCELREFSFIPKCHRFCQTCYGPSFDHCLTCRGNHVFYNNKCLCKGKTQGYEEPSECQLMQNAFKIIQEEEEEIKYNIQENEYFDEEGNTLCSYGQFIYKNKCVNCPYFDVRKQNIHIFCLNCYLNPSKYYEQPKCSIDAISYFNKEENTYELITRKETEIDYYEIIENGKDIYEVKLLFGKNNQNNSILCKKGFYQQNGQCLPCSFACIQCDHDLYCDQCEVGYYLNPQFNCEKCLVCDECEFKNDQMNCHRCPDTYYLNEEKKCMRCGKFCANCNSNGFCNYCIDTKKYYISLLNGKDCLICGIENCETCYHQPIFDGKIEYVSDPIFNLEEFNFGSNKDIITRCSKCNQGFTLVQIFKTDDTLYSWYCDEKKFQESQCSFLWMNQDFDSVCIMYSQDHGQKENCLEGLYYSCFKCKIGYYSDLETNDCIPCPTDCESCVQFYKDILPYNVQMNGYFSEEYKDYMNSIIPAELQIRRLTCKIGYLFYKNQCIQGCDSKCLQCEIINFKPTCIKCNQIFGFQKSLDFQSQCQQCQTNCAACIKRDSQDIKLINKYFIQTLQNQQQTQFCFYKYNIQDKDVYFFKNHYVVDECKKYKKCKSIFSLSWNLFCDVIQFQQIQEKNNDQFIQNYLVENFFDKNILNQIENDLFINYLNSNQFTQIEINLNLIQGGAQDCKIPSETILRSNLFSQVLLLQRLNLKIYSLTNCLFNKLSFELSGFSEITFKNLQIQNLRIKINEDYLNQINFQNCGMVETQTTDLQGFLFTSDKIFDLSIQNFTIQNMNYSNQIIFQFEFYSNNYDVQNIRITNLSISNSALYNSALLFINMVDSKQQINIKMADIKIIDTNFTSSTLVSSEGAKNLFIGVMQFQNVISANLLIIDSILFSLQNVRKAIFNQISIMDSQFQDGSYFLLSNNFECQNFIVTNINLSQSFLLSNQVDLFYQTNENKVVYINLVEFRLKNINYNNFQSILQVIKYQGCENFVNITSFQIIDLYYQLNDLQNFISQELALIHIECQICNLDQIVIERVNGLPEISILNSEKIQITNSIFTLSKQNQRKILYSSSNDCLKQQNVTQQFFYLYIGFYREIIIDNLQILESMAHNQPFIIIEGTNLMRKQVLEFIEIKNSIFKNNIMTISFSNSASSLIQVLSEQQSTFIIKNTQFSFNHLNAYISDLTVLCSSTILISIKLGTISIQNCQFYNNIITNSTNSIMYLKAEKVIIQNSFFYQSNFLNLTNLVKYIMFEENTKEVNAQDLSQAFLIYSKGGNGYILAKSINFFNLKIIQSFSKQGGSFYIDTFGDSVITIENSIFYKTQASLLSKWQINSLGGCFYIDAQLSNLTFIIKNTTFDTTLSRKKGGALYVLPSYSQNYLSFENINITNCFSIQSSFVDFSTQGWSAEVTNFEFKGIFIEQTQQGLDYFLSQLNQFTVNESNYLLNFNPLFQLDYGNLIFSQSQLLSETSIFLFQIDQAYNINIADIIVKNGRYFSSPLIKINIKLGYEQQVRFSNLKIFNLVEVNYENSSQICQNLNLQSLVNFYCLNQEFNRMNSIQLININQEENNNQLNCNKKILYSTDKQNYSLIQILNVQNTNFVSFNLIMFDSVSCNYCQYGLINLINVESNVQTNIELNEIFFKNCTCNQTSCLTILLDENENNFKTNSMNRILQQYDYNQIAQESNLQLILRDSQFISNTAKYGGGICIIGIDILILNSYFVNNTADIGGAIYYEKNKSKLLLLQTQIIDNTARIAGGLFLYDLSLQETLKLDVFLNNNNSTVSESDVLVKPSSLGISIDGGKTILLKKTISNTSEQVIEQIIIKPYEILGYQKNVQTLTFPSGQSIGSFSYFDFNKFSNVNYNLSFRIIALNKFEQKETINQGASCTLSYKIINTTNEQEMVKLISQISQSKGYFDTSTNDFNLDNLIIKFNPFYSKEVVLRLSINCDCVQIPIEEIRPPFQTTKMLNNYQLQVDIHTFPCQLGEYFNSNPGICVQCDPSQSQYQVIMNATSCLFKDDEKINQIKSQVIELKPDYWRPYFYSTQLEECLHLYENCIGGWYPGDASCTQGHIGALCEQCDIYNIRGDGQFSSKSLYKCGNCDQIVGNVFSIITIYIWTLITVLISVSSTIETIKQFITGSYLIVFGLRYLNKQSSTAVLIKIFTNYSQIIQTIFTFQLKIPENLFSVFHSVSNPIEQMAYSLDCFLTRISDTPIIYFRIIWNLLMSASYIVTFLILLGGAILRQKIKFNLSMITTLFIYIFIYSQPNMIQYLISLISFRVISEVEWISGNVSYRYDTSEHKLWLKTFCLPLLLIFSLIIPGFMFYKLRSQNLKLDSHKIRETWGYLYNEYAFKAYYWEFIKILQKEGIIIVLSYYEDYITIKAPLTFLFVFAYSYLTTSVSPYLTGELNKLDIQSTTICGISIILGGAIYSAQNFNLNELVYPFYSVIIILNSFYFFKVIFKIVYAYLNLLHEYTDKIKEIISLKYKKTLQRHPQLISMLESKKTKELRIKANFDKIRKFLFYEARKNLKIKQSAKVDFEYQTLMAMNTQIQSLPQVQTMQKLKSESQQISNEK